ncbi:MAG TPA: hypothetical protein VNQ76_07575 [Planctomicrobium sp.]|nr:hypothetical protein [Planctomicrobium sp.]
MRRYSSQWDTPDREVVCRKDRHFRPGQTFGIGKNFPNEGEVSFVCLYDVDITMPEVLDFYFQAPSAEHSSDKHAFLETMRALIGGQFLPTWGRVQQKEELEYERLIEQVAVSQPAHLQGYVENVLEEFEGFVEKFEGGVAHVTLKTQTGETLYGEYPAVELKTNGIRERRRFKCWTVERGSSVDFMMQPIPDRELSNDRVRQIDDWLQESLGDDDALQNDY